MTGEAAVKKSPPSICHRCVNKFEVFEQDCSLLRFRFVSGSFLACSLFSTTWPASFSGSFPVRFFGTFFVFNEFGSFVSGSFPVRFFGSSFVINNFPGSFFKKRILFSQKSRPFAAPDRLNSVETVRWRKLKGLIRSEIVVGTVFLVRPGTL